MLAANVLLIIGWMFSHIICLTANEDAKRLYDDLLVNYNRHRRPSRSPREPINIKLKLRLSQIIDVVCDLWACVKSTQLS